MFFSLVRAIKCGVFLPLSVFLLLSQTGHAQTMYATSGAGRGDLGSARLQAQLAVEKDRNDKAEACANAGQLYGPSFAGNKSVGGCLTDLTINSSGGITVSGNSTFNNNLAVTGTSAFTGNVTMDGTLIVSGTASAATPTAGSHLATKAYVDTAAASGGGGSGGVTYLGRTTSSYTGSMGGPGGASAKCVKDFGGCARMMNYDEYTRFRHAMSSSGWFDCRDNMIPLLYSGAGYRSCGDTTYHHSSYGTLDCHSWTAADAGTVVGLTAHPTQISPTTCNTSQPIHCVRQPGTSCDPNNTDPCAMSNPGIDTICNDGSKFVGFSGGQKIFVTSAITSGHKFNQTASGTAPYATDMNNGALNVAKLLARSGGDAPYPAAQYCDDLVANGHSDWYLPSINEAILLERNPNYSAYWSSTEYQYDTTYVYIAEPFGAHYNGPPNWGPPYSFQAPRTETFRVTPFGGSLSIITACVRRE